jgi:hypothetical protein
MAQMSKPDSVFLRSAAALCAGQNVDDVCVLAITLLMGGMHQRADGDKARALAMLDVTHRMMRKCMDEEFEQVEATGEAYECKRQHH